MQNSTENKKVSRKKYAPTTNSERKEKIQEFWLHGINPITGFEIKRESMSANKYFSEESYGGHVVNGRRL
jgi:hypothetical protein